MGLSHEVSSMIITVVVFSVVSSAFLGGRLYMRHRNHALGADDWLLVFALCAGYLDSAGALVLALKGGLGKPFMTLTPDELETLLKMLWMILIGYPLAGASIKLSILVSYRRIFERVEWLRWPIYILGACSIGWACGHLFSAIFQCTPVEKAWHPLIPGHCIDIKAFGRGNAIPNAVLDYLILLLPILPVWRLHMGVFQKILVSGSLGLGLIACAASTARAVSTSPVNSEDLSQTIFLNTIWIYVEPNAGIIAACLPIFTSAFAKRIRVMVTKMKKNSEGNSTPRSSPLHRAGGTIRRRDSVTVMYEPGATKNSYELVEKGVDRASVHSKPIGESANSTRHMV